MRSKRTQATSINEQTRKIIIERDNYRCINCGSTYMLTPAHYISRAYGGLGIPQNVVVLCVRCHREMDQGYDKEKRQAIKHKVADYLQECYPNFTDNERKYHK